jgi:hypothetical protein
MTGGHCLSYWRVSFSLLQINPPSTQPESERVLPDMLALPL